MEFYNKTIWEDHADKWLMPLEVFAQQHPQFTYEYYDDSHKGSREMEADLHPSPRQCVLWLEQELKDKLSISKNTFEEGLKIADRTDEHYAKTKMSKMKFSLGLAEDGFFTDVAPSVKWPVKNLGF